jgi:hypothetical protein
MRRLVSCGTSLSRHWSLSPLGRHRGVLARQEYPTSAEPLIGSIKNGSGGGANVRMVVRMVIEDGVDRRSAGKDMWPPIYVRIR